MSFVQTILAFLVALGILIAVHEFGHFWVARRLGVKVLRFSLGFGAPLWRRVGKVDGTEFVVAAVPLGGYVKMLDEREAPVAPSEVHRAFNRQSLPVRTAIVSAGPLFNLLFAILAYWLVFVSGETGIRPVVADVREGTVAAAAGIVAGDEFVAVAGRQTPTWQSVLFTLMSESVGSDSVQVQVRTENGRSRQLVLESPNLFDLADRGNLLVDLGLTPGPAVPPVIGQLVPGEAAEQAGLRQGDRLVSVDGVKLSSWVQWVEYVQARPAQSLDLVLERDGQVLNIELRTSRRLEGDREIGRIGAANAPMPEELRQLYLVEVHFGPASALGAALYRTWDMSRLMVRVVARMIVGRASVQNLSGPVSIAQAAGKTASYGLNYFLKFLAVVSISLGILNLLPIPVLDGGHLLYFLIEAVKGSPLSERVQMAGQRIGLALLLALMTLAFYIDLSRLLG